LDILWGFSSVENFNHRIFSRYCPRAVIQSHDVFITRWGFLFFYHYNFQGSCLRTVIQPLVVTTGLLICGFFLFNHEPYHPQRINKVGVSSEITPMATITYTHSPRTGVDSSRHTHGSASSPIVQGLVQDLNVYKTRGP